MQTRRTAMRKDMQSKSVDDPSSMQLQIVLMLTGHTKICKEPQTLCPQLLCNI